MTNCNSPERRDLKILTYVFYWILFGDGDPGKQKMVEKE